jgi:arginine exporter protein ArgO
MTNFITSILLALAIVAALGTQLVQTAQRNTQIPRCADCAMPARNLS